MSRKSEKGQYKKNRGKKQGKKHGQKPKESRSFSNEECDEPQRTFTANEVLWGRILYTITDTGVRKEPYM